MEGVEIEYIDISPLPMLNTDLEVEGTYPPEVEAFRKKILEADSILFASPEYNYSVTGESLISAILQALSLITYNGEDIIVPHLPQCYMWDYRGCHC